MKELSEDAEKNMTTEEKQKFAKISKGKHFPPSPLRSSVFALCHGATALEDGRARL